MSEPVELVGYKDHAQDPKDEEPASKDAPKESATEPQETPDGDRSSSSVERKLEPSTPADVPTPKPKDAATFESDKKVVLSSAAQQQRMDDDHDTRPINTGYQSFNDSVSESTNPQAVSSSTGARASSPSSGAIPPRYQSNQQRADRNLQDDLRQTATGRRGRRTTRRVPHYKIDADSDEGSDNSTIDENYDVASISSSIEEGLTWRGRMQHALHNHWFHVIIVILVVLDAFIVMFELLLDVGAFNNRRCSGETPIEQSEFCHYNTRGVCGPLAFQVLEGLNISTGNGEENLCICRFREGNYICAPATESIGVNPALILHICSLVILTVFMLEIIIKIVAFRLKYFTHKFEVFDGIVVVVSWVLDIASIVEEEAFEAAALIIILRLWRVVRIVNGAVLSSKAQSDRQLEEARSEARRIIHAFHKCQDKLDEMEEEKEKLLKRVEAQGNGDSVPVKRPRGTEDFYKPPPTTEKQ